MTDIDKIVEFVVTNGGPDYAKLPAADFIEAIKKHREYGTWMEVKDDKGLAGVARWNWTGKDEVEILDCIVRKDLRSARMIKYMIYLGFANNKNARFMTYNRFYKYPYSKKRRFKIGG